MTAHESTQIRGGRIACEQYFPDFDSHSGQNTDSYRTPWKTAPSENRKSSPASIINPSPSVEPPITDDTLSQQLTEIENAISDWTYKCLLLKKQTGSVQLWERLASEVEYLFPTGLQRDTSENDPLNDTWVIRALVANTLIRSLEIPSYSPEHWPKHFRESFESFKKAAAIGGRKSFFSGPSIPFVEIRRGAKTAQKPDRKWRYKRVFEDFEASFFNVICDEKSFQSMRSDMAKRAITKICNLLSRHYKLNDDLQTKLDEIGNRISGLCLKMARVHEGYRFLDASESIWFDSNTMVAYGVSSSPITELPAQISQHVFLLLFPTLCRQEFIGEGRLQDGVEKSVRKGRVILRIKPHNNSGNNSHQDSRTFRRRKRNEVIDSVTTAPAIPMSSESEDDDKTAETRKLEIEKLERIRAQAALQQIAAEMQLYSDDEEEVA